MVRIRLTVSERRRGKITIHNAFKGSSVNRARAHGWASQSMRMAPRARGAVDAVVPVVVLSRFVICLSSCADFAALRA